METGSYEWKIGGEKLLEMKNAKRKQVFLSDVFKMCELNWRIVAYPNGHKDNDEGSFNVYLKLLSLHKAWNHILLCKRIYCPQLKISVTSTKKYDDGHKNWGINRMYQSQIQDLEELTISINITILKIVLNDHNKILYQKNIVCSLNQKMELIQEKGDIYLLSLKEFIKNIVINEQYRSIIKESMENQQIPFWNKLSDDGKIKELTSRNDHHWH